MTIDSRTQLAMIDAMWRDWNSASPPKLLAHYTSIETVDKILSTGQLWLSNPLYMNDLEELRFGMHLGAQVFRQSEALRLACRNESGHELLLGAFERLFSEYDRTQALDVYVFCLSRHDDLDTDGVLSMWRGYGGQGSGAALLFDFAGFPSFNETPLHLCPVTYQSLQQRTEWLQQRTSALAEVLAASDPTEDNLIRAATTWFERLKLFALYHKHPGFSEEREWRIAYLRDRDQSDKMSSCLSYAIDSQGVTPKLKLPLSTLARAADDHPHSPLAGLLLGPSHGTTLAQASVRRMTELLGYAELPIHASTIPFRA